MRCHQVATLLGSAGFATGKKIDIYLPHDFEATIAVFRYNGDIAMGIESRAVTLYFRINLAGIIDYYSLDAMSVDDEIEHIRLPSLCRLFPPQCRTRGRWKNAYHSYSMIWRRHDILIFISHRSPGISKAALLLTQFTPATRYSKQISCIGWLHLRISQLPRLIFIFALAYRHI